MITYATTLVYPYILGRKWVNIAYRNSLFTPLMGASRHITNAGSAGNLYIDAKYTRRLKRFKDTVINVWFGE